MSKGKDIWKGKEIKKWTFLSFGQLIKFPTELLLFIDSARLPVALSENRLVMPRRRGILESIKREDGSIIMIINKSCVEKAERSERDEITLDAKSNISLGLPIFE